MVKRHEKQDRDTGLPITLCIYSTVFLYMGHYVQCRGVETVDAVQERNQALAHSDISVVPVSLLGEVGFN